MDTICRFLFLGIFLLGTLVIFAQDKGKTISIQNNNISIKDAFSQIEQQTGFSIAYEQSEIDLDKIISLVLKDAGIDEVLTQISIKSGLAYKINGYHIIIQSIETANENNVVESIEKQVPKDIQIDKNTIVYSGIVLDSITKDPLPYATISLFDQQSKFIASGATNDEGVFGISTVLTPSSIRVSFVGYETFVCEISQQNLTRILLSPNEKLLQEATVTASTIENKVDRNSYLITDKMREQASNAQELLDQIHGVRFDKISNTIKVGNETMVLLLVDDIQQSETYIKNLPTNRISKIEVITEPTGRHLSEGYTAVINFILKKDYSGYDINVRNFSMTSFAGYNGNDWLMNDQPGVGATYTKDKINIFGNYTYGRVKMNTPVWKKQTYTNILNVESEITNENNPNNQYNYLANYLGGGINYQITPNHSISFQTDYTFQKIKDETNFRYQVINIQEQSVGTSSSSTQNKTRDQDYVGTIFYKGEIGKNLKLYSDFTYNYYSNNIQNYYNQNNEYHQENLYRERKDYTKFNFEGEYTFTPKVAISAGYVNVWRKYNSKSMEAVELLDYTERRNQLFAYVQYKANDKLTMKAGTSIEYVDIKSGGKNSFWNIQPYIQSNYKINDKANLNFSYLTNSYYPTLYELSPMTTAIDSLMMQSGNPDIKSAVRHTITLKLTLWDRLTIKPMFKYIPKKISEIYTHEDNNFYSTFTNVNQKQYVLQIIYDQPIGKYFKLSNMFACFNDRARYKETKRSFGGSLWYSEFSYFNPKYSFGLELGYYRLLEKSLLLQGYQMVNMDSWSITLNKQFWNKRASLMVSYFPPLGLGVRDELNKEVNTPFYTEKYTQNLKPYRNMLMVRFSLRFNSGKIRSTSKQSSTEREERAKRAVDF